MNQAWFHEFFRGAAVDFWQAVAPPPDDDISFLTSVFGAPAGQEILDVPCGTGRHAIVLARAGYRVTGVDISADCLARAGDAASNLPSPSVEWRQSDMRDLPWSGRFDGVLCFGNSFGYMDRKGTGQFVAAVARAMKSGARFVLDTGAIAESLLPSLREQRWMEIGDLLFFSSAAYEAGESRLDVTYSFLRGGVRETRAAHTWIFTAGELRAILESSSLEVEAMYGSTKRDPFCLGSPRLILVAGKR